PRCTCSPERPFPREEVRFRPFVDGFATTRIEVDKVIKHVALAGRSRLLTCTTFCGWAVKVKNIVPHQPLLRTSSGEIGVYGVHRRSLAVGHSVGLAKVA